MRRAQAPNALERQGDRDSPGSASSPLQDKAGIDLRDMGLEMIGE